VTDPAQVEAVVDALRALLDGEMRRLEEHVEQRLRLHLGEVEARTADPWMTTERAAAYLSLSPEALRARVRRGTIPAHRDGDRWLFHRDELDAHVRRGEPAATITLGVHRKWAGTASTAPPRHQERKS